MSHSLPISKNFTAHQNKDAQSVPKYWATERLYCDYKEQPHLLEDYILKQRAQHLLVWIMHLPMLGDFTILLLGKQSSLLCCSVSWYRQTWNKVKNWEVRNAALQKQNRAQILNPFPLLHIPSSPLSTSLRAKINPNYKDPVRTEQ
jgi:hypothetical protein